MVRLYLDLMQRVPGEVHSTLDSLAPYIRQTSTGLNDRTDQAGPDHRTASHPVDVVGGHGSRPSVVVEIGKPAVLQPTAADQFSGLVEDIGHVIELGEPRTRLITESQLSGQDGVLPSSWGGDRRRRRSDCMEARW